MSASSYPRGLSFDAAKWLRPLAPVMTCGLIAGCEPLPEQMVFPGRKWMTATAESQGFDPEKFGEVIRWYGENTPHGRAREMIIVRRGRVIWEGPEVDQVHNVWSCTKTFTSTVLGLLVDDGIVTLDTPVAEVLPAMKGSYPEVTYRHLATMTSGYQAVNDWPPVGTYVNGPSDVWWQPATEPLFAPGTHYAYWDSAMNQLGRALEIAGGRHMEDVFQKEVADPIGMDPSGWSWNEFKLEDNTQVNGGSGNKRKGLHICAREMARLGHLYLNGGRWRGRQILSREWVAQATTVQAPADLPLGGPIDHGIEGAGFPMAGSGVYGFNWWVNGIGSDGKRLMEGAPERTFAARGFNNNFLFVIPEWEMVICRLGQDHVGGFKITEEFNGEFLRRLGEAMVEENATAP